MEFLVYFVVNKLLSFVSWWLIIKPLLLPEAGEEAGNKEVSDYFNQDKAEEDKGGHLKIFLKSNLFLLREKKERESLRKTTRMHISKNQ